MDKGKWLYDKKKKSHKIKQHTPSMKEMKFHVTIADHDYYTKSPTIDPKGPVSGQQRVLRGGSWHDGPAYCRAAFRNRNEPDYTCDDNGFRIVLETSNQ